MKTIAIVGGGIGGLSAALFLSRQGFEITVFEQAEKPLPVGAGFLLQPPGQRVLAELGVLDSVLELAVPIHGLQSITQSGRTLLDLSYSDLSGSRKTGLGVQRSTIYDALFSAAKRVEGVSFKWASHVDAVEQNSDAVTIKLGGETQRFDLCILSAGSNSHLADGIFEKRTSNTYEWGCIWTTIELPEGLAPNILHQRCHQAKRMMGILPILKDGDNHKAALYWSAKSKQMLQATEEEFAAVKQEMVDFWPEAKASIEPLNFSDFITTTYRDVWTPKPYKQRIVAIGDVSHATSPQLGQGCTMALLDAWLLAQSLSRHDGELEVVLEQWWKARKRQLQYVRYMSKWLTPLYQSDNRLFSVFRDYLMASVGRAPGFYDLQLRTLASEVLIKTSVTR